MKVRAMTIGIEPGVPLARQAIARAGRFAARFRVFCEDAGIPVQTTRLATPPFPQYLGGKTAAEIIRFAGEIQACCREYGIDYCALGPVGLDQQRLLDLVPDVIAATDLVFISAVLAEKAKPAENTTVKAIAQVIQRIARMTAGGFGNLRFAALLNCPPHIPFFPAAFHVGEPAFMLALEAADIVTSVWEPGMGLTTASTVLRQELECRILPLQDLALGAGGQGFVFRGIDLSPAPGPAPEISIAYALERLGLGRFGEPGTLTAAAVVTAALKETVLQTCGYCGLMLPVLEDHGLAERNNQGLLRLSSLLAYSAVCGTGLDTIPLPGDVNEDQLSALLFDVATLGWKLSKPLSARLFPIPGKRAGEYTEFDFPYFVNTRVMAVE
jgi:uncharacterized protein (UPF0210 family)